MGQSQSQLPEEPQSGLRTNPLPSRRASTRKVKGGFRHRMQAKRKQTKKTEKQRRGSAPQGPNKTTTGALGKRSARGKAYRRSSVVNPAHAKRTVGYNSHSTSVSSTPLHSGQSTPSLATGVAFSRKRYKWGKSDAGVFLASQVLQLIGPMDRYALETNWLSVMGHLDASMTLTQFTKWLREDGLSDRVARVFYRTLKHIPALLDPRFLPNYQPGGAGPGSGIASRRGSVDPNAITGIAARLRSRRPSIQLAELNPTAPESKSGITSEDLEEYATQPLNFREFLIAYGVYRGFLPSPGALPLSLLDHCDNTGTLIWKAMLTNLSPLLNQDDEMTQFLAELDGKTSENQVSTFMAEDWCVYLEGCAHLLNAAPLAWVSGHDELKEAGSTGDFSEADQTAMSHELVPEVRRLWRGFLQACYPEYHVQNTTTIPLNLGMTFVQRLGERWYVVLGEYLYRKFLSLPTQSFTLPGAQRSGELGPSLSPLAEASELALGNYSLGNEVPDVPKMTLPIKHYLLPRLDTHTTLQTSNGSGPGGLPIRPVLPLLDELQLWFMTWWVNPEWVHNTLPSGSALAANILSRPTTPTIAAQTLGKQGSHSLAPSRRGSLLPSDALESMRSGPTGPPLTGRADPWVASLPGTRRGSLAPPVGTRSGSRAGLPTIDPPATPMDHPTVTWHRLYVGSEHGFSLTQFSKQVFHYPSPTLLLVRAEHSEAVNLEHLALFKGYRDHVPLTDDQDDHSSQESLDDSSTTSSREVVMAILVDQPWKFARSFFGQTRCSMMVCNPLYHRLPSTAEVEAQRLHRPTPYDRLIGGFASPAASRRNSQMVPSDDYFAGRRGSNAGGPSLWVPTSPTPVQAPEKYQSVFTPPDQAQHEREPDQKYVYCHPTVGIGLGGLGTVPSKNAMTAGFANSLGANLSSSTGTAGGVGRAQGGRSALGRTRQAMDSLKLSGTPDLPFSFHIDSDFQTLTWFNDPFRINSGTVKSATSGTSSVLASLPFVPVDPVQDFSLSMHVLDVEVYGLGGHSAFAMQQRLRDAELKSLEKRSKLGAGYDKNSEQHRQILEWAGIISNQSELQAYRVTPKDSENQDTNE
ncbi:Restriction of telomere capping protein 5 [Dispira parvispora]|uniref:Restriction of telomere capping protein 5 n=1 Tax=Dispira parvispora TaxID=1520584 RepID=A0A9W8AR66_9FUNG|nr:Restriction of telomere capping protein 5 [Dispira parvispora]